MDKELAVRIEELHEKDDTMGHRKLAVMLATGKNRVKRVMRKYGIAARRTRKKYVYPGKASQVAPNLLRMPEEVEGKEIVFSDILEVRLSDGSRVRGCFALRKRTRAILGMAFDYHMRADLVTDTIQTMTFEVPGSIWHSDQGKQFGAEQTRHLLLQKGFRLSISRAGTPTDNGYAELGGWVLPRDVDDILVDCPREGFMEGSTQVGSTQVSSTQRNDRRILVIKSDS
jgi:putative transposase